MYNLLNVTKNLLEEIMSSEIEIKTEVDLPPHINKLFDLTGRVALVTSAAMGLGRGIAYGMAKYGADVVCADLNLSGAEETASRIREWGKKSIAIEYDVADFEQVKKMVDTAVKYFNKIDISFNLPGINIRKTVQDLTTEEFYKIINVNLNGMFNLCKAVSPFMIKQKKGKIINMSSLFGTCVMARQAAYASAKHGVLGLTKVLAIELAPYNIQVNAICPAHHLTHLAKQLVSDKAWYEEIVSHIPQKRFAEVWEIIGPCVFLASEATSFITGICLLNDGGWSTQ
jgi:NAD(P)-dependent dehydrogenase (short-subunit alcohol dehydrogenase family)